MSGDVLELAEMWMDLDYLYIYIFIYIYLYRQNGYILTKLAWVYFGMCMLWPDPRRVTRNTEIHMKCQYPKTPK